MRDSSFPPPDKRPYLASTSMWRQYALDNCATVSEALATLDQVRLAIPPGFLGSHFLISDAQGGCAALEFLDGRPVAHVGQTLPVRALTNSIYEESLAHWRQGTRPVWDTWNSIARFKTAARMIRDRKPASLQAGVEFAFSVLQAVAADSTQWRIVYDQVGGRVYYRTKKNPGLRTIDLGRLDFSCRTPVLMLDVDAPGQGEVNQAMTVYTPAANRALIGRSFGLTSFTKNIPATTLDSLAEHGGRSECVRP